MQDKNDKREKSIETRANDPGEAACLVLGNNQTRQMWERGDSLLPGTCRPAAARTQPSLLVFFSRRTTVLVPFPLFSSVLVLLGLAIYYVGMQGPHSSAGWRLGTTGWHVGSCLVGK